MNLLQTRTLVRTMLSEDTAAYWTDAMLNVFIQRSFLNVYTKMANLRRGYFETTQTITYVANQELYTLASVTMKVVLVERVDGLVPLPVNLRSIDITQKNDYAQMAGVDMTPGREKYFITGNSIGIAPIPRTAVTAALKLWYVPVPTLPSSDSDTFPTEMTDAHHDLIAHGALMRAVIRDKQALAQILPIYTELKKDLLEDTQVRNQQEPPQIIDTDPYDT
jgi:hypothetical protein